MMEYEEDLITTQLDDYEDDADDATEMQLTLKYPLTGPTVSSPQERHQSSA